MSGMQRNRPQGQIGPDDPFTVDLLWWKDRLWFSVHRGDGTQVRRYEITGGGAGRIVWEGEGNAR